MNVNGESKDTKCFKAERQAEKITKECKLCTDRQSRQKVSGIPSLS